MGEWKHFVARVETTWHPIGRGRFGAVTFEQRVNGQPTGLSFTVPRWRYWMIRALAYAKMRRWPIVHRIYDHQNVEYCWLYLGPPGKRGQA